MARRMALKQRSDEIVRPQREHDPDEDFKIAHTLRGKSGTVSVALKLPNGLFLQLYEMQEQQEPILGGGFRTFKVAKPKGPKYRLNGNTYPFGRLPRHLIIDGYGITPGIPEDVWREWCRQNADSDLIANKLIYAHKSGEVIADKAREHASTVSGLEPLTVKKDGTLDTKDMRLRAFGKKGNLTGIQPMDKE